MTWTNVAQETSNVFGPASPPIVAGGNLWSVCGFETSGLSNGIPTICTPSGGLSQGGLVGNWGVQGGPQIVQDGSYVYCAFTDLYPRNWIAYWSISSPSTEVTYQPIPQESSLILSGSVKAIIGSFHPQASFSWTPPTTYSAVASLTGTTGNASYAFYDGNAYIWSLSQGSGAAQLVKVNASTLAFIALYTLPYNAYQGQPGYDGRYIYIPAATTGIVVFDTTTNTATTVTTTYQVLACFYSANTSTLFISTEGASSTGSIYTMPLGGGSLTLSQALNAAFLGGTFTGYAMGFCDGPASDVWATVNDNVSTPLNLWFIQYTAGSGARIVMIL